VRRGTALLAAVLASVLVADLVLLATHHPTDPQGPADPVRAARPPPDPRKGAAARDPVAEAATRFLDRYVDGSGRVVRIDEAGDTVSEGQAYAMLLAVAVDDRATFDRAWRWAEQHLQRPDGLLAWRWAGGAVADPEPASDADLDAAWALALAAARWPDGAYDAAAARLASAVASLETATLPDGRPVLVPGPWARSRALAGRGMVLNPSYSSPVGEAVLVAAGHLPGPGSDARLGAMRSIIGALIDGRGVPTDWATVGPDGAVHGLAGPDDPGAGHFGWDAVRTPLRLAGSCAEDDVALAARTWPAIEAGAGVDRMGDHPARLVGAAAAAAAADHRERAAELLERATAADARAPTYYGGALTALGWALLTTDRLGGCPPLR